MQALGWAAGVDSIRGIGALSAASPLPFVFSSFRGFETFATGFEIELVRQDGERVHHVVTPELYAKLDGPYNRRNTYGAVLAYGPALDSPDERRLVDDVLEYGLCRRGPLAQRFGEALPITNAVVVVRSKTRSGPAPFRRELSCSD
jgi:hypothetical protein